MRRPFIAGNWKMNLDRAGATELARAVATQWAAPSPVDVAVCPPSVYLDAVGGAIAGSSVGLGAQDMCHAPNGAFTGEISSEMLLDLGCRYVILGHSERRQLMRESSSDVNQKLVAALRTSLTPIVCVGETLDQREAGQTSSVVREQLEVSFSGLSASEVSRLVIAYEPVWAIGTGKVATPEQAEEVHADLRRFLETSYNSEVAATVRIQYGGSVKPANAAELLAQDNIDGALVGGASLQVDSFLGIVNAAQ